MNKLTEETKAKISKSMIGNTNRLGYKVTDEKVLYRMSVAIKKWHKSKGHKINKRKKKEEIMKKESNKPTKMVKEICRKCGKVFYAKKGSLMQTSKLCAQHIVN